MKLAILGSGKIVEDFLTMVIDIPSIELMAIFATERSLEKMEKMQKDYKIKKIYTNIESCLSDKEIDTVYVALPNDLHFEFSKKALLANKNVICEKPFTLSLKEAETLEEIANQRKLILIEAITNQYLETYQKIKEDIPKLGNLKIIECNYSQYSSRYDDFKKGIILPAFDHKKGGGALMDINIYNIHFIVGLFGLPKKVNYLANIEHKIDTSGILLLDYESFKVSCIGAKDCSSEVKSTIAGDGGFISVVGPTNTIGKYIKKIGNNEVQEVLNINKHRMYEEFIVFENIIDNQKFDIANEMMEHSKNVLKVVELALKDANINLG